jgi:hypothetical protein
MEFFRDMAPENQVLTNLGKLLYELTKQESMAKRYYEEYLAKFFDSIFTSAYFYWSNLRFIIVYIANFKFVWSGLKFNQGFVKSFLRAIHLNPHFLNLVQEKIEKFDEFLSLHEVRYNPEFLDKLSKVKNPKDIVERIMQVRATHLEQHGCCKVKNQNFATQIDD